MLDDGMLRLSFHLLYAGLRWQQSSLAKSFAPHLVTLLEGRILTLLELAPHYDAHGDLLQSSVGTINVD